MVKRPVRWDCKADELRTVLHKDGEAAFYKAAQKYVDSFNPVSTVGLPGSGSFVANSTPGAVFGPPEAESSPGEPIRGEDGEIDWAATWAAAGNVYSPEDSRQDTGSFIGPPEADQVLNEDGTVDWVATYAQRGQGGDWRTLEPNPNALVDEGASATPWGESITSAAKGWIEGVQADGAQVIRDREAAKMESEEFFDQPTRSSGETYYRNNLPFTQGRHSPKIPHGDGKSFNVGWVCGSSTRLIRMISRIELTSGYVRDSLMAAF